METWLALVIIAACMGFIFMTLVCAVIISAEKRITKKNKLIKELIKQNNHKQELLDQYGIKELVIGGEEDE